MINRADIHRRALMYSHTLDRNRVDVVGLDPYGTAAPFIDSAVQCVNDGGLYLPQYWFNDSRFYLNSVF